MLRFVGDRPSLGHGSLLSSIRARLAPFPRSYGSPFCVLRVLHLQGVLHERHL